jgi:hypothetical protein
MRASFDVREKQKTKLTYTCITFKSAPYLVVFQIAMYTHNEEILLLGGHTHELKKNFTIKRI